MTNLKNRVENNSSNSRRIDRTNSLGHKKSFTNFFHETDKNDPILDKTRNNVEIEMKEINKIKCEFCKNRYGYCI